MRALVSGGLGFLGSNLVRRLHQAGHGVTVLDDMSRGKPIRIMDLLFEDSPTQLLQGDVRDYDDVKQAAVGCDAVIHMAMVQGTQNFTERPRKTMDVAIKGTMNMLRACAEFGIRDFMLLSSSEAYQGERDKIPTDESVWLSVPDVLNPRFAYGGGKIAMELMCAAYQMDGVLDRLIIARPHNIYGPDMGREHVIPEFAIRMNEVPRSPLAPQQFGIQGSGQETRSFCYISDAIDGLMMLLDKAPQGPSIWHLGTEDERDIEQVAHAVAACYDQKLHVNPGKLPKGSPPRRCPDISKMKALGYSPKVGFDEGIRKAVEFYKNGG